MLTYKSNKQLNHKTTATGRFSGYAAIYDYKDKHQDILMPGCFSDFLKIHPVENIKLLWQHDPELEIGIINNMVEDDIGLKIDATLNLETNLGMDAYIMLQRNKINSLSVGFNVVDCYDDMQNDYRAITSAHLAEVSLVCDPANPLAKIIKVDT